MVRTAEEIEAEEAGKSLEAQACHGDEGMTEIKSTAATKEAMDELAALTEQMTIDKKAKIRERKAKGKKQAARGGDAEMNDGDAVPSIQIKSKAIKKTQREKNRFKKSRKQLLH